MNRFQQQHDFNVNDKNKDYWRNFLAPKNIVSEIYNLDNSRFFSLPDDLAKNILLKENIANSNNFVVKIIVPEKNVQTMKKMKSKDYKKYYEVKNKAIEKGNWDFKKNTAVISIKPGRFYWAHIIDKENNELYKKIKIYYETFFQILESNEISYSKYYKEEKHTKENKEIDINTITQKMDRHCYDIWFLINQESKITETRINRPKDKQNKEIDVNEITKLPDQYVFGENGEVTSEEIKELFK